MSSLVEELAAASKIEAFRQERSMQKGVKTGYRQYAYGTSVTRFVSQPLPIGKGDFSVEYCGNTYGSSSVTYDSLFNAAQAQPFGVGCFMIYSGVAGRNGVAWVLFEGSTADALQLDFYQADLQERFHLVITRSGKTVRVYINGFLTATKEQSAVKDFPEFRLGLANSSDICFARMYDYALSAADVTAIWNSGDPAGYVLPTAMKRDKGGGCVAEYLAQNIVPAWSNSARPAQIVSESSYTWTGGEDIYAQAIRIAEPLAEGKPWRVTVSVSDYESGAPFILVNAKTTINIPSANGTYTFLFMQTNGFGNEFYIYGGQSSTDRRLTLTVDRLEPARGIGSMWLDSSRQLPFNDEYLPPLLKTASGCDMTASGFPEIL